MTTLTDLANAALGLLGETEITDITDTTVKAAKVCNRHAEQALYETLRLGRWNCASRRAYLLESAPAAWAVGTTYAFNAEVTYGTTHYASRAAANLAKEPTVTSGWEDWWAADEGYQKKFALPADFLRLLEINGEAVRAHDEFFEIEGAYLLTDESSVWIRYIAAVAISACDVLLQSAAAARLASRIAIPLTGRIEQANAFEALFARRLAEAQKIDAHETGSGDNPAWEKVLTRSRLVRLRGWGPGDPLQRGR